jgi:hypothetical protein
MQRPGSVLHRPAQSLACRDTPPRPAQAFMIFTPLSHAPQACTSMHNPCCAGPGPQGLPSHEPHTDIHNLSWATHSGLHRPPRSLLSCAPHACTGLHDLRDHAPKACQASNPQTCRISIPLAHTHQAHQAHTPKARLFASKGLHLKACGTTLTFHLPQEGSQPA